MSPKFVLILGYGCVHKLYKSAPRWQKFKFRYLAAQGNGRIHIFALDFDELLEIAQSRVTRGLTDAECKEYLHVEVCPQE